MKKFLSVLLVVVLLMSLAAPALAASKVYVKGNANIREEPNKSSASLGTVKKGSTLTYKGSYKTDSRGVKWYKVSYKGSTGWISSLMSSLSSSGSASKPSTSSSKKVTATGSANVRKGPGLGYASIGVVEKGSSFKYLGDTKKDGRGVTWYKVEFGSKTGWISERVSKRSGSSSKPTTSAKDKIVTDGSANIRKGPGLGYASMGAVPDGSSFKYLGSAKKDSRGVTWFKVQYGDKTGWISSRVSKHKGGSSSSSSGSSARSVSTSAANRVTAHGNVNLRTGAGTGYSVVTSVADGSTLPYRGTTKTAANGSKWYNVTYNGESVWISAAHSTLTTASGVSYAAADADTTGEESFESIINDTNVETTSDDTTVTVLTPDLTDDTTEGFTTEAMSVAPATYVEVSQYYGNKLIESAMSLQISNIETVETDGGKNIVKYADDTDALSFSGEGETIESINITGAGFTVFGVCVGMDIVSAENLLAAAGLEKQADALMIVYRHAAENATGYDYAVTLYTDLNSNVSIIEMGAIQEA